MSNLESANISRDGEKYFQLMNQFLLVQASLLNDTLKECGVKSAEKRQEICQTYGLSIGEVFDCQWIKSNDKKVLPAAHVLRGVSYGLEETVQCG